MNNMPMACVIDDDQVYTFVVRKLMEKTKFTNKTIFFDNGKKALDYFTENHLDTELMPDLILLDLNMPVLDGWQFLSEYEKMVSRINKKVSLYIVSSSIDDADHNRAKQFDTVSDFIIKPLDPYILQEIFSKWSMN